MQDLPCFMINKGTRDKAGRADRENERLAINTASSLVTGISERPLALRRVFHRMARRAAITQGLGSWC